VFNRGGGGGGGNDGRGGGEIAAASVQNPIPSTQFPEIVPKNPNTGPLNVNGVPPGPPKGPYVFLRFDLKDRLFTKFPACPETAVIVSFADNVKLSATPDVPPLGNVAPLR
jgi:hypothetical protein